MSLMYDIEVFKNQLKSCKDRKDAEILYSVVVDQVSRMGMAVDEARRNLEDKEHALEQAQKAIDEYKSAMMDRICEIQGK